LDISIGLVVAFLRILVTPLLEALSDFLIRIVHQKRAWPTVVVVALLAEIFTDTLVGLLPAVFSHQPLIVAICRTSLTYICNVLVASNCQFGPFSSACWFGLGSFLRRRIVVFGQRHPIEENHLRLGNVPVVVPLRNLLGLVVVVLGDTDLG